MASWHFDRWLRFAVPGFWLVLAGCLDARLAEDGAWGVAAGKIAAACGWVLLGGAAAEWVRGRRAGCAGWVAGGGFGAIFALELAEVGSYYFSGESFNFQFYYHISPETLRYGSAGLGWGMIAAGAAAWLIPVGLTVWCWRGCRAPVLPRGVLAGALVAGALILSVAPSALRNALVFGGELWRERTTARADAAELQRAGIKIAPVDRDSIQAAPGKNLLLIYLESMESGYLDENRYPALMPRLKYWMSRPEALVFTDISPAENATFTVGGIYASLTGSVFTMPQLVRPPDADETHGWNHGIDPVVGNRLSSLPDVLRRAGYWQGFMQSNSFAFAGENVMLGALGYDWLESAADRKRQVVSADWGGLSDRKLFRGAYRLFRRLAAKPRPFALSLLTIDTHPATGIRHPSSIRYTGRAKSDPMLDAVHTLDRDLGEFLDALSRHPRFRDTVIWITGDHLAMNNASNYDELRENPRRRLLVFALNGGVVGQNPEPGKIFDAAPTILALMGVRHNHVFPLGENLLAHPDPKRLTADDAEGRRLLGRYMVERTSRTLPRQFEFTVALLPYPSLRIGMLAEPLYLKRWGFQGFPGKKDTLILCLDGAGRLLHRVYCDDGELAAHLAACPDGKLRLYFCGGESEVLARHGVANPDGARYFLIAAGREKVISVRGGDPLQLRLAVDRAALP